MPNLVTHYIFGERLAKKLGRESTEFLLGSIAPDYLPKPMHYKKVNENNFKIPDINAFFVDFDFKNNDYSIAYYAHLILDVFYIQNYITKVVYKNRDFSENIFVPEKIYTDYSTLSLKYLEEYSKTLNEIDDFKKNFDSTYNLEKYNTDINYIKAADPNMEMKYIKFEEFKKFIDESLEIVYEKIQQNFIKKH